MYEKKKSGKNKSDIVLIHKWEGEPNSKDYISKIKAGETTYIGIIDSDMTKEGYGYLSLPNNERYFGFFTDNLKSKHGLYEYQDKFDGEKVEREFYLDLMKIWMKMIL